MQKIILMKNNIKIKLSVCTMQFNSFHNNVQNTNKLRRRGLTDQDATESKTCKRKGNLRWKAVASHSIFHFPFSNRAFRKSGRTWESRVSLMDTHFCCKFYQIKQQEQIPKQNPKGIGKWLRHRRLGVTIRRAFGSRWGTGVTIRRSQVHTLLQQLL